MIADLKRIKEIWNVWINMHGEKISIEEAIKKVESEAYQISNKSCGWLLAIWIIIAVIGFWNLGLLWGLGILIVGYFVQAAIDDLLHKKKRETEAEVYLNSKMPPLQEQKEIVEKKIADYQETDDFLFAFRSNYIAEKYNTVAALTEIIGYLEDGRADSKKEAINLYESVQHELRMEEMQKSIQDATEATAAEATKQTSRLDNIEKNTHQAAQTAKVNAAISYGTYRNTKKVNKKLK